MLVEKVTLSIRVEKKPGAIYYYFNENYIHCKIIVLLIIFYTENMTIGIQINYNSSDSYSNYLIDFNDTSIIEFPKSINSTTLIYHTFPQSGYYNVNVTIYNQVSSKSTNVLVCRLKI